MPTQQNKCQVRKKMEDQKGTGGFVLVIERGVPSVLILSLTLRVSVSLISPTHSPTPHTSALSSAFPLEFK